VVVVFAVCFVDGVCADLTVAGASGAFSAAGVGVGGTPKPLLVPANRLFAGAVAGGATEKPENGFDAFGAGVALTVWSLALSGNDIRLNRSPPDEVGAFGVAVLSVECSVVAPFVSVGLEIRLKRSLPGVAAGCEAPKRLEPPPKADDAG
jgi:hypothetical protein